MTTRAVTAYTHVCQHCGWEWLSRSKRPDRCPGRRCPHPTRWDGAPGPRTITVNGETLSLLAWARRTGVARSTIIWRLAHGWSEAEAATTPRRGRAAAKGGE